MPLVGLDAFIDSCMTRRSFLLTNLVLLYLVFTRHSASMRIVFLSLEFSSGTFSGNGVYAMSQVRALRAAGHDVLVISARPPSCQGAPEPSQGPHVEVEVSTWGRLDVGSPWKEYAQGCATQAVVTAVQQFTPEVCFGVDWSSLPAYRNLKPYLTPALPYVYLNYRVYSRDSRDPDDLALLQRLEVEAMQEAVAVVALSRSDADFLVRMLPADVAGTTEAPKVLLPALREDVRQLAPPVLAPAPARHVGAAGHADGSDAPQQQQQHHGHPDFAASRPYLTCVVRLSPEKEPHRFVELVEALSEQGLLIKHGITPLMLGVATGDYADGLKERLKAAHPPSILLTQFMGPSELAEVYRKTRLNIHPATYDAYGMTIVEAASQGAPSLVHDGNGAVGATDLLDGREGEVFLADLGAGPQALANAVGRVLSDGAAMAATAWRACHKARSWDEAANAAGLIGIVQQALHARRAEQVAPQA